MKRFLFLLFLVCVSFAYSKTITGEATYTYGEAETILDAKKLCENLALQNAIESFATYISSESVVKNYITERSELVTRSQGMVQNIEYDTQVDKANSKVISKVKGDIDEKKIFAIYEAREKIKLEQVKAERKLQDERFEAERKAQSEKLEHERKIAEINYKTKEIESSMVLNQKNKNYWKTQKWIGLGAFIGSAGLGTYFNSQGSAYYDDYKGAISTSTALNFYDKADSNYLYRDVTFSVSLVPLGYFFYAWYKESKY